VQAVAKLHKIVVVLKGGQINPHAVVIESCDNYGYPK
jgi:hypothetical protein